MPTKKTKKKADGENGEHVDAVHQLVQPSEELAAIVGADPIARGEVISRMWAYIKENKLQDPEDGRQINADDKLKPIFEQDKMSMFEMNKRIFAHLS